MKYYRRYPGDYAKDTAHLSLLEHGVYAVLLDFQYGNGSVLPSETRLLYRICRAQKRTEREAVDRVVEWFFPEGWNPRAKQELTKAEKAVEKMREGGREGAEKRWGTPSLSHGVPHGVGHPTRARSNLQPPIPLETSSKSISSETDVSVSEFSAKTSNGNRVCMEDIKAVLLHLNRAAGTGYRLLNPHDKATRHAEQVRAVLKKGYSVDDCKRVIDRKAEQWRNDDKMAQYLRPSTLFRISNFEQYLDGK